PVNERNLFWRSDSTYDIAMAQRKNAGQAAQLTIAAFNAAIAQVPGTAAATWLTWDRNWFRSAHHGAEYGDVNARIFPFLVAPFMEAEEAVASLSA
ncbi:unnamed protein product, partial [marine sediment metagenome]